MTNIQKIDSDIAKIVKHFHQNGEIKTFIEDIYLITLFVAGLYYVDDIDEIFSNLKKDDYLNLYRETNNQYDKYAILVKYGERKIGYVPRDNNRILANLMDGGKELYGVIEDWGIDGVYEGDEFKFIKFKIFLKEY